MNVMMVINCDYHEAKVTPKFIRNSEKIEISEKSFGKFKTIIIFTSEVGYFASTGAVLQNLKRRCLKSILTVSGNPS